jgi:hypothetical protein
MSTPGAPVFQQAAQSPPHVIPTTALISAVATIKLRAMGCIFIYYATALRLELIRMYCHQGDPEVYPQSSSVWDF